MEHPTPAEQAPSARIRAQGSPGYTAQTVDGETVTIVAIHHVDGELRLVGSDATEYRHAESPVDNRLRRVEAPSVPPVSGLL